MDALSKYTSGEKLLEETITRLGMTISAQFKCQCKIRSLKIEDIINDQLQCTRLTTKRTELAISILEAFLYSAVDAPKCLGVRL